MEVKSKPGTTFLPLHRIPYRHLLHPCRGVCYHAIQTFLVLKRGNFGVCRTATRAKVKAARSGSPVFCSVLLPPAPPLASFCHAPFNTLHRNRYSEGLGRVANHQLSARRFRPRLLPSAGLQKMFYIWPSSNAHLLTDGASGVLLGLRGRRAQSLYAT